MRRIADDLSICYHFCRVNDIMPGNRSVGTLLVRRLDDGVKERLRQRAKDRGRSLEAEVREILVDAAMATVPGVSSKGFGTQMAELFKDIGLTAEERRRIDQHVEGRRRKLRTRFTKSDT